VQDTASGHSQVDGPTTPNPLAAGDARDVVTRTVRTILADFSALDSYLAGEDYVQHNPRFGDGISGLAVALAQLAEQGITMTYDEITHVVAEGDFAHTRSVGVLRLHALRLSRPVPRSGRARRRALVRHGVALATAPMDLSRTRATSTGDTQLMVEGEQSDEC
jgi:hypothetical protein